MVSVAILILLILGLLASVPLLGYLIGRRRGGAFFASRQRPGLLSFYRVLLTGGSLCLFFCLVLFLSDPAVGVVGGMAMGFAILAGIFVLEMLVIGLSLFGGFVFAGRHYPPGHCQCCGYNLRGNVSGRCPECGKPISETIIP